MTVGAAISSVYMASAAYPTAADAILGVRSLINYEDVCSSIAQMRAFSALKRPTNGL